MQRFPVFLKLLCGLLAGMLVIGTARAQTDERIRTIAQIKPSVVAIATWDKMRVPALNFIGTGFVVRDGLTVITNAHVVKSIGTGDQREILGIVTGDRGRADFREARIVSSDAERDLARLQISGSSLPALKIGDSDGVREGQTLLFTGFPLGMLLGFHHVTHRAMVSAITPIAIPAASAHRLNPAIIRRLELSPYHVFQLDGTAYPGNSGSPLYDPETGEVVGIINKVFVKGTKEAAITHPSGITYAIPAKFILELLEGQAR